MWCQSGKVLAKCGIAAGWGREMGCHIWPTIRPDWPLMGQIWDFLRSFGAIWHNLDVKFDILGVFIDTGWSLLFPATQCECDIMRSIRCGHQIKHKSLFYVIDHTFIHAISHSLDLIVSCSIRIIYRSHKKKLLD